MVTYYGVGIVLTCLEWKKLRILAFALSFNSDQKVIAVLVDQMPSRNHVTHVTHVTMLAITIIVEIVSSTCIPTCMQIPAKTASIVIFSKKLVYILCFFSIGFLGRLWFNNHVVFIGRWRI